MKQVVYSIIAIIAVLGGGMFIGLQYLKHQPVVKENYTQKIEPKGDLEATYLQKGAYETIDTLSIPVFDHNKKFSIVYPTTSSEQPLPVVIFANGTGIPVSKYLAQLQHFASWGFIAIGSEEESSWNGASTQQAINLLQSLQTITTIEDKTNPLYQKIDLDAIGVIGHSQGGVGAIHAATSIPNAPLVKTIISLSPTSMELAKALMWQYDASLLQVPTLLASGTGHVDTSTIISLPQLQDIYDCISDDTLKIKLRLTGVDHGDTLTRLDGYNIAWMLWHLQADELAMSVFVGEHPELYRNDNMQDVESNV
ncbi:MAG: chlorophyllase/cutinase-like alpha/beta fold protein [Erysipelotrichaceae bacterium]